MPFDSVDFVAHDTDRGDGGGGSHSGRSMRLGATSSARRPTIIIDKGRRIAEHLLETGEVDIEFENGRFRGEGHRPRGRPVRGGARRRRRASDLPAELQGPLDAASPTRPLPVASFPYGTQVCEVEVDPDTGEVEIVGYVAVDDVGRAVNPLILHGQTHGGIAQGVGQALAREQPLRPGERADCWRRASWTTRMPRAETFRPYITALSEVPAPTNRLGIRSGGEGGTTPALAVVINAIVDALSELRRAPHRDAGDAGAGLAGDPSRAQRQSGRSPTDGQIACGVTRVLQL